ncbi:MAG TPA: sigma-70 family RNA polymerase sigma factor [Firmicutes bacterium]|nr:sigma-70 family RNA polymerase sigma factor [Bacillota bacterium]
MAASGVQEPFERRDCSSSEGAVALDRGPGSGKTLASKKTAVQQKRREFEDEALPHLGVLYETAYHLARDESAAQDLVQETFLRAFRFWDKYEKGTNCRAWLLRILRNTFINEYRRKAPESHRIDPATLDRYYSELVESATVPVQRDPAEELFANLVDDEIIEALEQLPEEFREVVILSDLQDLSYKEIAEVLECPVGTVRSRLSRGRKLLQSLLYDFAVEGGFIRAGSGGKAKEDESES